MSVMPDTPAHAAPRTYTAAWAVWAILIGCGAAEVAFNVYHSVHGGLLIAPLALLLGVMPVFAAVLLSHVVSVNRAGWGLRAILFTVMAAAMLMSIGSIAAVVAPVTGKPGSILFGLVLDAASLTALWVVTSDHQRKTAAADAVEAARQAATDAQATAAEAQSRSAALEAELERSRTETQALLERLAAPAPVARSSGTRRRAPVARKSAPVKSAPDDVDLEASALNLLASDLDMTGAELARQLDISPSYGRKLRKRLTEGDRIPVAPTEG